MQHLILLHGALGAASQFSALSEALRGRYHVHTFDFSGHGGRAFSTEGFSIPVFADELLRYLDEHRLEEVSVFGYSMGGYVALYLATRHPGRIRRIMTLGTKFQWDPAGAEKEVKMLDPEKIAQKVPAFAQQLEERHAPGDWKTVMQRTAEMMLGLGADSALKETDYPGIEIPVLLLLGDRDKMVTLEETLAVYRQLPQAGLGILPFAGHPLEQVPGEELVFRVQQFFND